MEAPPQALYPQYVPLPRPTRERLKAISREQHRTVPGVILMLIDRYLAEQASAQEAGGGGR